MSFFSSISAAADDPILGLQSTFVNDSRDKKVNLVIGAYKDADGQPQVLNCVRRAEEIILRKLLNKEYPRIDGDQPYINEALKLIYGDNERLKAEKIVGLQTLGGTGALNLGADFLYRNGISSTVYLSDPTWANHNLIFSFAGMKLEKYNYYDKEGKKFDFAAMLNSINSIQSNCTILFQPCCHNPTGIDPSFEQWREISQIIKKRKIIPFFDLAYLGFGENIEKDANVVRLFVEDGHEMLTAFSFSKNFGLYGERVGVLSFVTDDEKRATDMVSQLKIIIRANYSMPPLQGPRIVSTILQNEDLKKEWIKELSIMRNRIQDMRKTLAWKLQKKIGNNDFDHLSNQKGMFSFSGLTVEHIANLQQNFGIYMTKNGRINVAGLNPSNLDYVIESIATAVS